MRSLKVHFIHVGNMSNKGTQALFKSDVNAIRDILRGPSITTSTVDIEGVRKLSLSLTAILPPAVDIPYEKADEMIKKHGGNRGCVRYMVFVLAMFFFMSAQILLTVLAVIMAKLRLKGLYRAEVFERVRDCDLVISHSDETFKESASFLPLNLSWTLTWWSMLIARTWEIMVAKSFRKPIMLFPNSVGPFKTWFGRFLAKFCLNNCSCLLIRDPISYRIVDSLGIRTNRILTYDTALQFSAARREVLSDIPRPLMGVSPGIYSHSLSKEKVRNYISSHAAALDAAIEKYGFHVVFLPHYISGFRHDDLEVCKFILSEMKSKDQAKIVSLSTADEFKVFLDQMDMIISSKMHPAVLGASGGVPILCIAYDHKQTSFFERLGMIDCTIDIRNVSGDVLLSRIDYVWNNRGKLRALLEDRIPEWKKHTRESMMRALASFV